MKKLFLQCYNHPLLGLLFRYGVVGVAASFVHFSIAYIAHEKYNFIPQIAHFFGFMLGLFTAYFGHYFYSFKDKQQHSKRFWKFALISIIAFFMHQGGVFVLHDYYHFDYSTRVLPFLVVTVPVFTFLLNKFWVFSELS